MSTIASYLAAQSAANPEQKAEYDELARLHQGKLWYQFSQKMVSLLDSESFQEEKRILNLYTNVIAKMSEYDKKLNPLDLAQIVGAAALQCPAEAAPSFIDQASKVLEEQPQAHVLLKMAKGRQLLSNGKIEEAATIIGEGKKIMDDYSGIMDNVVQTLLYRASFELHKAKDEQGPYFENAMLFLVYSGVEKLKPAEQKQLAHDIGLAALTGKDTYGFGELLRHPILKALAGTPQAWLPDLLLAFNKGDINAWNTIFETQSKKTPELKTNFKTLSDKIRIMAIMDLAFSRPSGDRKFDYKEVCARCQMKEDEVDLLLIKALSQGVIKGVIDGVEKYIRITYLKPRVLDKQQLLLMKCGLEEWSNSVSQAAIFLENNSPELLPKDISTAA
eukprot:gb/GEZN01003348.1/.p1 GENE.gb/GEZN01003348.1/~~gb/GEZN01003348.1/.p1  ORF type:complete len:389 (+),score=76.23 gb/GEZN01003348.1/:99-1265(+)